MFIKRVKIPQPKHNPFIKRVSRVDPFIRFYQNQKKYLRKKIFMKKQANNIFNIKFKTNE